MSEHIITVDSGKSIRLKTAGKYCEKDIIVQANAPKIADLKDTTWKLKDRPYFTENEVYNINFASNGTQYSRFALEMYEDDSGEYEYIYYDYEAVYQDFTGVWGNAEHQYITITGGADVKNTNLINTLYAIGELQSLPSGEENQLPALLDGTLTDIDSDVTKVIAYACYGIATLQTVNLPNATSIGGYAFRGCSGITEFNAPKVTSLGNYAFYGCSKITEVNFQGISAIPSTCFYQCTSLTRADFGVKCKSISASGLAYCSKLTTLILRYTEGVVSITTNAFSGANFKGYVYVPSALLADYEANSNWASYAGTPKFRAIEDYPDICG